MRKHHIQDKKVFLKILLNLIINSFIIIIGSFLNFIHKNITNFVYIFYIVFINFNFNRFL